MPYLIGTDEAGYAPNLGPLVVSASLWHVDRPSDGADLYRRLRGVICRTPSRTSAMRRLAIADSKALYSPAQGLSVLERGVLTALAIVDRLPENWHEAWQLLDPDSHGRLDEQPWHLDFERTLPLQAERDDLAAIGPKVARGMQRAGVRLLALRSRAVFPDEFNRSNQAWGNKAETLSKVTLALVGEMLSLCAGGPVLVVCDKHGGRNLYGRLLQQQFPDPLIEVRGEGSARSTYCWGPESARIEVQFRTGGEAFLPAALASMTAKYLRELAMHAFNAFWCARLPGLLPTAGYPRDARRFKSAIEPLQSSLGITDQIVWRNC
jgi:hypothetical protein